MPCAPTRTLSVSIERPPGAVVAFVTDPLHLPRWATGFAQAVHRDESGWLVDTVDGPVRIEFVAENPFGVVDHRVVAAGLDVLVPMRIVPNEDGAEVLFTLVRPAGTTDAAFDRDAALVEADLRRLKQVLEGELT